MEQWNEGYFTQSTYIYDYFYELSPVFQRFCLLLHGYLADDPGSDAVHCELGFGQGVTANIHAAANPGKYVGTDFNPNHAAHANELSKAACSGALFFDDSFAEFLNRDDLPRFDSISLHGIWSWISKENQETLLAIAHKFLKPGGILYNSYNALPGWAPFAPLRELFFQYDQHARESSKTKKRVDMAIQFAEEMLKANPLYLNMVPAITERLASIAKQDPNYLAHEYLNQDWHCMYFSEVAKMHSDLAKLTFACTAEPLDIINSINLRPDAVAFLAKIEDPVLREQARDYFVGRQFRKDLYLRGSRMLNAAEKKERLLNTRMVLIATGDISMKVKGALGEATLQEETYTRVIDWFRQNDNAPRMLREFTYAFPDVSYAVLEEVVTILFGKGVLMPCQSEKAEEDVRMQTAALNASLCQRAMNSNDITTLASPVLGSGVVCNRFEQIFLHLRRKEEKTTAEELAARTWEILKGQGQQIIKEGKTLETDEENQTELQSQAESFLQKRLVLLSALGIC